ncbi:hypothetical protein LLH00_17760 [bacterium]|nr:hypothetical protein [bacterium]
MADLTSMDLMGTEEETSEESHSFDELLDSSSKELEWLIPPEQFVDFWVAGIFLLVGTWQIITIMFLMLQ